MAIKQAFNLQPKMVFPSTKMDSINKLITEGNLTRLINKLIDTDSYLISPNEVDFTTTVEKSEGTMIPILPTIVANTDLEFMLHGYYFNLGTLTSALTTFTTESGNNNSKLVARVYVDITDENYPELFGEKDINQQSPEITANVVSGTIIPNEYWNKSISSITIYGSNGGTQLETSAGYDPTTHSIIILSGTPSTATFNKYVIHYKDYSNIINLYAVGLNGDSIADDNIAGTTSYTTYDLELVYKYDNEFYYPLQSFAKFGSRSIINIDGGTMTPIN